MAQHPKVGRGVRVRVGSSGETYGRSVCVSSCCCSRAITRDRRPVMFGIAGIMCRDCRTPPHTDWTGTAAHCIEEQTSLWMAFRTDGGGLIGNDIRTCAPDPVACFACFAYFTYLLACLLIHGGSFTRARHVCCCAGLRNTPSMGYLATSWLAGCSCFEARMDGWMGIPERKIRYKKKKARRMACSRLKRT